MKKQTITQKRATLFREWLLATLANDEGYYFHTLYTGIPDGDSMETVLYDLEDGLYDDDIDETIALYLEAKSLYGNSGYYVRGKLFNDENSALAAAGYLSPLKIYKRR